VNIVTVVLCVISFVLGLLVCQTGIVG
jgi:hypothetical protein